MSGMVEKTKVINLLLDLRNQFSESFEGYRGDVLVQEFQEKIDEKLKEI